MNDKELLVAAARAVGMRIGYEDDCWFQTSRDGDVALYSAGRPATWNPLTDDGDALRLAVKLGIPIDFQDGEDACTWAQQIFEIHGDPYAATRRAIVRAAAEIGSLHNAESNGRTSDPTRTPGYRAVTNKGEK